MSYRHLRLTAVWGALLVLGVANSAHAQDSSDDAARAAARNAGYDGVKAFQSGDFAVASEKLGRAYGVVKLPTLGLWYARALAKSGKLVEASERYREVVQLEVTEGRVKEQRAAQAEAAADLEALVPRIPMLTIQVHDATPESSVTLDGMAVDPSLFGLATPINPTKHVLQAKREGVFREARFQLAEGEKKTVEISLKSDGGEPVTTTTATGAAPTLPPQQQGAIDPISAEESKGSTQKTLGWVTLGFGGAVTTVGIVSGILVLSKRSELDASGNCVGTHCASSENDARVTFNSMRTISTIGFAVGAVGLGIGTTLLLTTPKSKTERVEAWVGVDSVGVRGTF